ncbi:esterase-like activity of phytase family protein [Bacillus sp. FJAT-42376]|uniref:esterase-like activity of phytase family protein n=1 Tax=Bacillus sp. FJAT-42376 TaxID=2014076 RepID=UPI000F4EA358|nr:esterase-like activity of phytase family protein [Bacillus sp. FJAT-42376]AZB41528.1 esterase-like activity of phytase family protein [Bacillus sp. FJAT-42376]
MNLQNALKMIITSAICFTLFACSNNQQETRKEKESASGSSSVKLIGKYQLENPPVLAKGIHAGMGSSLVHLPGDPDHVFYSSSDRGPNGELTVNKEERRTFPIPAYTPVVYRIEISEGKINITDTIPLKLPKGSDPVTGKSLITGLPNVKGKDEIPYDAKGKRVLSYDPYGLDTEGLAYNPADETFWLSDEYGPSLVQMKKDGTLIQRFVPSGMETAFKNASLLPVKGNLPAVLSKRADNRGFESAAITPDGRYLFTMTQSALENPDDSSRITRLLKIDLKASKVIAEYTYRFEDGKKFGVDQEDIVASDLYAIDEHRLLVDERDTASGKEAKYKKIYQIDLQEATNVLDKDQAKGKTLEQMNTKDLKAEGIKTAAKKEVLDLLKFGYPYEKAEGITLVGKKLAVINDDDFGMADSNSKTELWLFRLP